MYKGMQIQKKKICRRCACVSSEYDITN